VSRDGGETVEVVRLRLGGAEVRLDRSYRIDAEAPPSAIAFDVGGQRAFLAGRGRPWVSVAQLDVPTAGGEPWKVAAGGGPVVSPDGGRVVYARDSLEPQAVTFPGS
jgi:hypothetical protein